jgi:hypothetical protein
MDLPSAEAEAYNHMAAELLPVDARNRRDYKVLVAGNPLVDAHIDRL